MSPDEDGASKRATAKIDPGDASTNGIPILKNRHYTRREKEQAIEISKKLCYVNLDMASLHKVPLKTAANYLYIPQCSLRSWLKEEYQIILMPPNAKRRPPQLKSIRNPAKADSSYKSYLLMSLQMLQRIKLIRSGDIYKVRIMIRSTSMDMKLTLFSDNSYTHGRILFLLLASTADADV